MVRLTRALVVSRPWHALTLFLLGLVAIAAAVAAPAYARMARHSVAASDVATVRYRDQSVSVTHQIVLRDYPDRPGTAVDTDPGRLARTASTLVRIRGFAGAYDISVNVAAGRTFQDYYDDDSHQLLDNALIAFRSDACAHVSIVAGRCVVAPREVLVTESTAADLGVGPGATMEVHFGYSRTTTDRRAVLVPEGDPQTISIVGVYRVPDLASDPYWAGSAFVLSGGMHLLAGLDTMAAIAPFRENQTYVVYPLPGALDPENLPAVRADLTASLTRARAAGREPVTQLPALLSRIELDQRRAAIGPAVAGVPLVLLCWFVIFLAVTQTAQSRRTELAVVKLRGASTVDRWWLALAESVLPLAAGGAAGFLAGPVVISWFGRISLAYPSPAQLTGQSWLFGAIGLGGAVAASTLALRRDLRTSIVDLLRRVGRIRSWPGLALVAVAAALAGVAVTQAHENASLDPGGLVLLGPALVILTVGLLLAGLLDPLADRVGGFALRRGHLGLGLAAAQIGRPRTSRRVVALLSVSIGLLLFAVTADGVSVDARDGQARAEVGANRVLTMDRTDPGGLLRTVREIDPTGAYAMAAVSLPGNGTGSGLLAVDADRLPAVGYWPGTGTAAAAVALMRPTLADPIVVRDRYLLVDAAYTPGTGPVPDGMTADQLVDTLLAVFLPVGNGESILSTEVRLIPGSHTYRLGMPCLNGCRLTALNPRLFAYAETVTSPSLTITRLRSGDGATVLADAAQLDSWRDSSKGALNLVPEPAGLRLDAAPGERVTALIRPPDQTDALPVVTAGDANVRGLDSITGSFYVDRVGSTSTLPRLGASGGIADLDVALRDGVLFTGGVQQVWLNGSAPPGTVDRLDAAGLRVLEEQTFATAVATAGQRPRALGWRFLVVLSVFALVLSAAGLVLTATVERRGRAELARILRGQGVPARTVRAAGLIGYVSVVACGLIFGALAALLAWWLDGAYLPIVEGRALGQGLPGLPGPTALRAGLVAAASLLAVAGAATFFAPVNRRATMPT